MCMCKSIYVYLIYFVFLNLGAELSQSKVIDGKWKDRVGTALAAPKYHLTNQPIMLEESKNQRAWLFHN